MPQRQSPPRGGKPQDPPSGQHCSAWPRLLTAGLLTFSGSRPRTSRRPQPGRRASARPPACGHRCPRPAPHLPAAAAARRPARMKSSRPGGSPHSAPAAGGEGPPPAAGKGAWAARPTAATPPGGRVISYYNAFTGGASRDGGPREKSRDDCLCDAPSSARAPVTRAAWTAPCRRAGFPTPLVLPPGIVHFAEFEAGLSFKLNIQRIRDVLNWPPVSQSPWGAPHPPPTRTHSRVAHDCGSWDLWPPRLRHGRETPAAAESERLEEAERGRPRIGGCSGGHLVDRCSL